MSLDFMAEYVLGIAVDYTMFFTRHVKTVNQCENGHVHAEPIPAFCPLCGKPVQNQVEVDVPIPELTKWLIANDYDPTDDAHEIWHNIMRNTKFGIHDMTPYKTDDPDEYPVFGMYVGSIRSNGDIFEASEYSLTQLLDLAAQITEEAHTLGISGEVKLYLKLDISY